MIAESPAARNCPRTSVATNGAGPNRCVCALFGRNLRRIRSPLSFAASGLCRAWCRQLTPRWQAITRLICPTLSAQYAQYAQYVAAPDLINVQRTDRFFVRNSSYCFGQQFCSRQLTNLFTFFGLFAKRNGVSYDHLIKIRIRDSGDRRS